MACLHFVESDKIALRIVRTSAAIWQGYSVSGGTRRAAGKLKGLRHQNWLGHCCQLSCDPVITKLDAVLKQISLPGIRWYQRCNQFEDHRDEDIAGAEQLRRHENQLVKLEARVGTLEAAATPT